MATFLEKGLLIYVMGNRFSTYPSKNFFSPEPQEDSSQPWLTWCPCREGPETTSNGVKLLKQATFLFVQNKNIEEKHHFPFSPVLPPPRLLRTKRLRIVKTN